MDQDAIDAVNATQQAVTDQTALLQQHSGMLKDVVHSIKDVGDSIKGLVQILTLQQNAAQTA